MAKKSVTSRYYSEAFKRAIVSEILSGRSSQNAMRKRYGIGGAETIAKWIKRYAMEVLVYEQNTVMATPTDPEEEIKRLRAQLQALHEQLKASELKASAYQKMIEVAERELQIEIRKKSVTKRSEK